MNASQIIFETMTQDHLGEAVALSAQAGWPHRREDWALVLALSTGVVALEDGRVVGTAVTTLFGGDTATINMVIVDESMRGRGLGRKLMQTALEAADKRICFLIATEVGLPLYEKLGFVATGEIVQHQGVVSGVDAPDNVSWATPEDFAQFIVLDRLAAGHDRCELMRLLVERAQFAVVRTDGAVNAFAAIRAFGRGFAIGPVVASNDSEARALIGFLLSQHMGEFVRVDTHISTNLAKWLAQCGLVHVGGGISMRRAANMQQKNRIASPYRTYALVNQALG
jgi:GNAT superfamily N-acetyltransferase